MAVGMKAAAIGVSAVSLVSLLSGIAYHYGPTLPSSNNILDISNGNEGGAVAGRIVSIPVKAYKQAFKASLKLGQCPLVMQEGTIKTCSDEFEGSVVHIAKGATTVDVTRVQSSEDILLHVMGGVGTSVGVLGLVSVSPKVTVAVTTETSRKSLNLMSSYEINKGVATLHNPSPKKIEGDKAMFLSEIELGGNELLLVTLEFESEKQKVEVEVSVTFKILFISITAKLKFVHTAFNAKASCRIQFKSSWRRELDLSYSSLDMCIPKVEEIEKMYMNGPTELRDMSPDDERSHYFYYFSSWKASPYGKQFNLALINHDLDFLTGQNTEMKAVIERINRSHKQSWSSDIRKQMVQLNQTLTDKTHKLTSGLDKYHNLSPSDRQGLRDIYGADKAPQYYVRWLNKIIA